MDTRLVRKKAFLFACAIAISTNALGDGVEENFSELFDAVDLVALDIDVQAANIVVVGGDEARARVNWSIDYRTDDPEKAAELRDAMRLEASTESGQLRVLLRQGVGKGWKRFFQWGSQPRIRLEVTVPSSMQVTARTSGGGIEVLNMNGDCIVKTSGGRIEMDRINGDVMARTSGGAIRLDAIDGNMDVKTSGGAIKIEDSMGSVEAKTSGGSIDIETMGEIVIAETTGGSVSAEVSGIEVKAVDLNSTRSSTGRNPGCED